MSCRPFLTALAFASVVFVSCKNSGTTGLPIPKDATLVVHIDAASLTKKLSWKDIQESEWFKDLSKKETDSFHKKLLENPANSGVDTKSDFAVFMEKRGNGSYWVFEGHLKSADDFEKTVKAMHEQAKIETDGDLKYVKDNDATLSWNKSKFLIVGGARFGASRYSEDGNEINNFSGDSLLKITKELLSLSKDNSIESNDRFTSLIKEDGDVHYYMNMEQYYTMFGSSNMFGNSPVSAIMTGMQNLFKGNVATGTLSFDDGKITGKFKQYYGEQMTRLMDKYKMQNVSEDLVNRIPSQNVVAAIAVNFPPEATKEFIKAANMDGFVNMALGKFNITFDELVSATKGQALIAVSDLTMKTKSESMFPKPDMNVLVAVSVGNKANFDKLISTAEAQLGQGGEKKMIDSMIKYKTTNDWFAGSNYQQTVDQFLAGTKNNLPFAGTISGHPIGMYIDIQKIIRAFETPGGNNDIMEASAGMWQNFVFVGGDYKDGVSTSEMTVNLVDKSTNSLKQMNTYIQKMYDAQKKAQADMMRNYQGMGVDSAVVTPAEPQ